MVNFYCFVCRHVCQIPRELEVSYKEKGTSLFGFPKCVVRYQKWLEFCGITAEEATTNIRLCSLHFKTSEFVEPFAKALGGKLVLKPDANPSLIYPNSNENHINHCPIEITAVPKLLNQQELKRDNSMTTSIIALPPTDKDASLVEEETIQENQSPSEVEEEITYPFNKETAENNSKATVFGSDEIVPTKRKCLEPRYISEVEASDFASARKTQKTLSLIKQWDLKKNKKIKQLQDKNRYLKKKVQSLEDLINHLKNNGMMSETAGGAIMDTLPESIQEIISRKLKAKGKYSPELKSFALTLHFYSPRAYRYVRQKWKNLLPHPSTIKKWYSVVDGQPGFSKEALDAIEIETRKIHQPLIVNLVLDEMSIREKITYNQGKFYGVVDCGTGDSAGATSENENIPKAKYALVIMAVAINSHWKVPIAYFLIRSLNGTERSNILKQAFYLLDERKVKVFSLTFDGASSNLSMCVALGAKFDYEKDFRPYFLNPITQEKCFVFLDLSHMIKLVRNTLGDKKIIKHRNGSSACWAYIVKLHELQKKHGLHLANKITQKHINYENNRMNVQLAMQTLSESTSKALLALFNMHEDEEIRNTFAGCLETSIFAQNFNNIADMLNCKNKFSKGKYNCALTEENFEMQLELTKPLINYIEQLTVENGTPLLKSGRKTGFLGLIIDMQNMFELFKLAKQYGLTYLLTYKLSQDYLETFFSAIRSRGGFNNNPSALQFQHSYKRMLVRHELRNFENGNCLSDDITILKVTEKRNVLNSNFMRVAEEENAIFELNYFDQDYISTCWELNRLVENIVMYLAGYISKKVQKQVKCNECIKYLIGQEMPLLTTIKNRGPFIAPSKDVINICIKSEQILRSNKNFLADKNIKKKLVVKIFSSLDKPFNSKEMDDHIKSQDILDNHRVLMIKLIIELYINVRLYHEAKQLSEKESYIRNKYTKLILFQGQ